mmetsp:Transcript_22308/g.46418  ORF Transcript_22308/g.46418 Transcript_22308/m.46418 type:complete len:233 (-) Transcript_22308:340-1038(-)
MSLRIHPVEPLEVSVLFERVPLRIRSSGQTRPRARLQAARYEAGARLRKLELRFRERRLVSVGQLIRQVIVGHALLHPPHRILLHALLIRSPSRQQLEGHNAQHINVRREPMLVGMRQHLRGHVWLGATAQGAVRRLLRDAHRDTKVRQLGVTIRPEHNIIRLHVAVYDPVFVARTQRERTKRDVEARVVLVEKVSPRHVEPKITAKHKVHYDVARVIVLKAVVHVDQKVTF